MKELEVMDAQTLLYHPLEKPNFILDGLIPAGLSLFCGSQKIGKSWLMLRLCLQVSRGLPVWDIPTKESEVLYLCLEDTFYRIQDRLFKLTDEASTRLLNMSAAFYTRRRKRFTVEAEKFDTCGGRIGQCRRRRFIGA